MTLWDAALDASSQNLIARLDAGVLTSLTRSLTNVDPVAVFQHEGSNRGPRDTVGGLGVATLGDAVTWSEAIVIEGKMPPCLPILSHALESLELCAGGVSRACTDWVVNTAVPAAVVAFT